MPDSDDRRTSLAACLIVRDAGETLAACLRSVSGAVDEVVVYDTGSVDDTMAIARSFGASVTEGYWDDDFARARNDALAAVTATWVFAIDADETCELDRAGLDRFLRGVGEAALVSVERRDATPHAGPTRIRIPRLFRRAGAVWHGRVHEWLEVPTPAGEPAGVAHCDPAVLRLNHDGYADEAGAYAKGQRNTRIGAAEVAQLCADPHTTPSRLARALLDLGRSLLASRDPANASQAFDAVRQLVRLDTTWASATDFLARAHLQTGDFAGAQVLSAELREWGAEPQYCDWLLAQALAQSGEPARAAQLLGRITALTDPGGRHHDLAPVREFRALARTLAAAQDAAAPS